MWEKIKQGNTNMAGESLLRQKNITWNKEGDDSVMKSNSQGRDTNDESVCSKQNRFLTYQINLTNLS